MMTAVQTYILNMIREAGRPFLSVRLKGEDALVFSFVDENILVRYYPEIESYQLVRRNSITNAVENNVSMRDIRDSACFRVA